jgi:hypothetical protein
MSEAGPKLQTVSAENSLVCRSYLASKASNASMRLHGQSPAQGRQRWNAKFSFQQYE